MWKVLLCEDEPVVRAALVEQIPWEQAGFTLIAEADNGADALELIRSLQPDLVITDIVMPGLDGIELLQQARAFSEARFVMLTCMNEFEYVRLALEYGASGYLLKLSADEKALGEMLGKLDKELKEQSLHQGSREPFRFQQEYRELWERLLSGRDAATGREEAGYLHRLHELYPLAEVRVLLPACRKNAEMVEAQWKQALPSQCLLHRVDHSGVITFVVWMGSAAAPPLPQQEEPLQPEPGCAIVRRGGSSYLGLLELWRSALLELNSLWYEDGGAAGQEERAPGGQGTDPQPGGAEEQPQERTACIPAVGWSLSWSKEKRWMRCLEARDREGLRQLAGEIWREMRQAFVWFFQAEGMADRLLTLAAHVWDRADPPTVDAYAGAGGHIALKMRLEEQLDRFLEELYQSERTDTGREEINRVMEYVLLHLKEDISLRAMAHYVNLDERYLSTLFSKQTGGTFIYFLQQARVARAKSLLLETDLPIREIGEQTGFANENYFYRIFKRWTGETPAQFRKGKP
ncbi:MAG: pocR [Paenibacillaceae bacterium]|jgi:two-component system response regulator YesN|nr:pocR [Paenibacillaceae bacterium]